MRFVNSDEHSRSLIPLPDASLALARPEGGRVLSEMTNEALAVARGPLHKIGKYEWCEPDYRQILLWAEELDLEPEEVIRRMLDRGSLYRDKRGLETPVPAWQETVFGNGRIISLNWSLDLLPIGGFTWIEGLEIEYLRIASDAEFLRWRRTSFESSREPRYRHFSGEQPMLISEHSWDWDRMQDHLDKAYFHFLTHAARSKLPLVRVSLPKLKELRCEGLRIEELDLSNSPSLESLECSYNRLKRLSLANAPALRTLHCACNKLGIIDLAEVPQLQILRCANNEVNEISFGDPLLEMRVLDCHENRIGELDLSSVPNLEELDCSTNPMEQLDLRPLLSVSTLLYGNEDLHPWDYDPWEYPRNVRLLQRPDQNFR